MKLLRKLALSLVVLWWLCPPGKAAAADATEPLYQNNFEKLEVGKTPGDFLVIDGSFAVQPDGTNKVLELPGAPLDTYSALFGPTVKSDVAVSARIFGTAKGRRFPTFGLGLSGQDGYKLQVAPAKKLLELYHGEDLLTSVAYEWKSGQWTMLRLQVVKAGDSWQLEGKAWTAGEREPDKPAIAFVEKTEPSAGRATIWGSPFATTPILYDDLLVKKVEPK